MMETQVRTQQPIGLSVSPGWAKEAINLTSASLEVCFDHLRETFHKQPGVDDNSVSQTISITLVPKLTSK